MRKTLPGFSLIEMAYVLIIVGLIGGMTFPLVSLLIAHQKESRTHDHQEKIFYALAAYVNQYKKLPYPAGKDGKANPAKCCTGYVPYAALGLAETVAKDGHQQWFLYTVDKELTETDVLNGEMKGIGLNKAFCDVETRLVLNDNESTWAIVLTRLDAQGNRPKEVSLINSQAVTRNNLMAIYARNPCRGQDG